MSQEEEMEARDGRSCRVGVTAAARRTASEQRGTEWRRRRAGISRAMTGSAGRVCVRVCASRDAYWLIPEHMSDS